MPDLKINITAGGGQRTADEVKKVTAATGELAAASKKNAAASKEAGTALDDFGRRGSAAKDAFEGVSMAANGGAGAIFGFSKAWVNLKEAFAANPITAILGILLGVLGLVQKGFDLLVQRAEAARDKLYGTGEQTKKVTESMAALESATKTALEGAGKDAAKLLQTLGTLNSGIDTSISRLKLLTDARDAAEISDLEVNRQRDLNAATNPEQVAGINRNYDARVAGIKSRSASTVDLAEGNAILAKIANIVNSQGDAQNLISNADAAVASATGPRERDSATKIAAKVRAEQEAVIAKLEDEIVGYENQLRARRYLETAAINTNTARGLAFAREDTLATTGPAINAARESALRIARQAPDSFQPEGYRPDLFKSPEDRATQYAEVQARNNSRQAAIAKAAAGVEQAANKLGDNRDEAGDLQRLEAALTNLANAASLNGNRALKQLTDRINTIEAQLKNTDR